jgi:HSP20 family protein
MALLMRPEPFTEFNRIVNNLFAPGESAPQRWMPPMDLVEVDDHFVLKADLPGMDDGDVSLEVQDNTLTLSGERRAEHEERQRGFYRVERSFGRFSRSVTLPEGVDSEAITARFENGVLEVSIPKPQERTPRRVAIQAGARREPGTLEGVVTDE